MSQTHISGIPPFSTRARRRKPETHALCLGAGREQVRRDMRGSARARPYLWREHLQTSRRLVSPLSHNLAHLTSFRFAKPACSGRHNELKAK